ncbi:MAG: VanZ family protein, partial [Paenibacillaceae bacterium]|nr:VanZ family protein [Paenibacillaceae bacterium]
VPVGQINRAFDVDDIMLNFIGAAIGRLMLRSPGGGRTRR